MKTNWIRLPMIFRRFFSASYCAFQLKCGRTLGLNKSVTGSGSVQSPQTQTRFQRTGNPLLRFLQMEEGRNVND